METTFTFSKKNLSECALLLGILLLSSLATLGQTLYQVEVSDSQFDPADLQIVVGDTVEWTNIFGTHNVNGNKNFFPSNPESFGNNVGEGWTYRHVFDIAGKYDYRCDPHTNVGMAGTVTVLESEQYNLTVEFSSMNPHVGQDFYLAVIDSASGKEVGRKHTTAEVEFSVEVAGIEPEKTYHVDFWADHNGNGMYDAPSTDHAWRLSLSGVEADTTLTFVHNTNFTDIMWKNLLTMEFERMTPHVGQDFFLALVNDSAETTVHRVKTIADEEFSIDLPYIEMGKSYHVDFWADHNSNGMYDTPPSDHAWRIDLTNLEGDSTVVFQQNTDFTDIMWQNVLAVKFSEMNPHVGQDFYLAVVNKTSGMEVGRVHSTAEVVFMLEVPGIETGSSYYLDLWADHNSNGMYDTPPTDHAWRLDLDDVTGDTTFMFVHNTDFTDIMWKSLLTVQFNGMNPHVGQDFYLSVSDSASGTEINRVHLIADTSFSVDVAGIEEDKLYYIDFWADHNQNGMYDTPPTDHAWRLKLDNINGDTTVVFQHNTNFTDIMWKNQLSINFQAMNPHLGQTFTLYVIDIPNDTIRDTIVVEKIENPDFIIYSYAIEQGGTYHINFWADHNSNDEYDAPPTDHAWQIQLEDVSGDTTITFVHNTEFTDIFPVTSVDIPETNLFKVYPNPATNVVWIEGTQRNIQDFTVSVYDITGKTKSISKSLQQNRIEMDISGIPQGLYFVELKSADIKHTIKLIKR